MDHGIVRRTENATQRSDVFRLGIRGSNGEFSPETRECPQCGQAIGRREGTTEMDALPAGVKFEPSDEELLEHLRAQVFEYPPSHPRIGEFISTLEGEDGICQTHPENLPGVKKDGSSRHFFHRPAKAYSTGTRKRRKINSEAEESGVETRWHKTGKTRPVMEAGAHLGWKKIMVLYRNSNSGKKKVESEKTNWILHQYHLGPNEEEKEGELVVCKVFFQKQPRQCKGVKQADGANVDCVITNTTSAPNQFRELTDISVTCFSETSRAVLVTPKKYAPHRPQHRRSQEVGSPLSLAVEEMRGTKTPTQSGRDSDLTVLGKHDIQTAPASDLTSTLRFAISNHSDLNLCTKTGSLQSGVPIHSAPLETLHEDGSTDWNEEVSTPEKPRENGNSVTNNFLFQEEELLPDNSQLPCLGPDTAQVDFSFLLCEEEPSALDTVLMEWQTESGVGIDDIFNPNPEYPYNDFLMSTPPAIQADFTISSQEAGDWFQKITYYSLDNSDSLSST